MPGDLVDLVDSQLAGQTVLAALRHLEPEQSWSQLRKRLAARQVQINGVLCLEEARRLREGDRIERLSRSAAPPPGQDSVQVVFQDTDLLIVDKPAGMATERHSKEAKWPDWRKAQRPSLDEVVQRLIQPPGTSGRWSELVHRLDRETSGLLAVALTTAARDSLVEQFSRHSPHRVYLAAVLGTPEPQTIRSMLIRDRGDGLRGSGPGGEPAVTHVEVAAQAGEYSLVKCRLETGRTNQIRIHLSEAGFPVCGDGKYRGLPGQALPDPSGCPRLALHAAELGVRHPRTGEFLKWESPLPAELERWLRQHRLT